MIEFKPIYSLLNVIFIPFALVYLLSFIAFFERRLRKRYRSTEDTFVLKRSLISIRDAALVSVGLDISQLIQALDVVWYEKVWALTSYYFVIPTLLISILLIFHLSVLIYSIRLEIVHPLKRKTDTDVWDKWGSVYVAFLVLLTNAVTLLHVTQLIV